MAAGGVIDPVPSHFVVFLAGFMAGAVLWAVSLSSLIAWGRRFVHPRLFRWINLLSGLALGYFGLRLLLGVIGVCLRFRLALDALRSAWTGGMPQVEADNRGHFVSGALLSLSNPFAIAFWLGVGGAMAARGVIDPEPSHFVVFFAGFMAVAVLWAVSLSSLIAWARRFVHPRLFRWINLLSGVALGYFGLRLLLGIILSPS